MPDAIDGIANEFRLSRISSIRKELVDERDTRTALSKKYRKALKIVNSIHRLTFYDFHANRTGNFVARSIRHPRYRNRWRYRRHVFDCQPGERKIMFTNTKTRKH